MSIFELDDSVVSACIRAVRAAEKDTEPDGDQVSDLFARAAWTGIAEPGDRIAGTLVSALGAPAALSAVLERRTAASITRQLEVHSVVLAEPEVVEALARWQPRVASAPALLALRQAERFRVTLVVPGDSAWPVGMDDLGMHAPIALWVRGNLHAVCALDRSISLVGARAATGYGEHVAMEASAGLVDRGFTIVSGAAYGIDGMAHRAALASNGQTVAFLAGGVDRFYPSGHDALLNRIVESGAVISELPCGAQPTKWRFLQRNRLIAAASQATVVIEAGWRSGSLNTAGHAAALGRPLGAVPGPVTSAASAGCHRLIREYDAICVNGAEQMAELAPGAEVGPSAQPQELRQPETESTGSDDVRVLDAMSTRVPRTAVDIAARSGHSVDTIRAILGVAELDGTVKERERGWIKAPTPPPRSTSSPGSPTS